MEITPSKRFLLPLASGLAGAAGLAALYLGIVSLAESPTHAIELFLDDWPLVVPIILGFGVQTALYTILKKRLFVSGSSRATDGKMIGAGGAASTASMLACCAHHVTDVLPILGLSAASAFLAEYRLAFMLAGLITNLIGIAVITATILRERRKIIRLSASLDSAQLEFE